MSEQQCHCDRCVEDRVHNVHYTRIMNAAKPAYDAISALVKANYELVGELIAVTRERDRLAAEREEARSA